MQKNKVPQWLFYDFWTVLSDEQIYPQIRAISVKYDVNKKEIFSRFYLDREVTEFDSEKINLILELLANNYINDSKVDKITDDIVFSDSSGKNLDPLDGFIYSRREYDIDENPTNEPTYFSPKDIG